MGSWYVSNTEQPIAVIKGGSLVAKDGPTRYREVVLTSYDNPFINAAITFTEPFPMGLIVTLISAAILRKKKSHQG